MSNLALIRLGAWTAFALVVGSSCNGPLVKESGMPKPQWPPTQAATFVWDTALSAEVYQDKLLGALVGSAIGDALGAPTEMWHRDFIRPEWGYVDQFTPLIRPGDGEGPWEDNLPPGGTTDDTRWKYLAGQFLAQHPPGTPLVAKAWARFVVEAYEKEVAKVKTTIAFDPEPLEAQVRQMAWLQEWAKVAKPFAQNDLEAYAAALGKFYGGEMACAGMLYAPLIGAFFPAQPEVAYNEAFKLAIFDIGYARDITGLTAALVAAAMKPNISFADLLATCRTVDPQRYANSRLVGRMAQGIYQSARYISYTARQINTPDPLVAGQFGPSRRDPLYLTRVAKAYSLLDEKLQDTPFHAGEIHLINLTALLFAEGDFQQALEFVVNYGRDNDTVAAVTGAILGAWLGLRQLPPALVQQAMRTNREILGMDLRRLAQDLAQ